MDSPVVATLKIELYQDKSYMVIGCLSNKWLALDLLDKARAQVLKYHEPNDEIPLA